MCLSMEISVLKITLRFFALSQGEIELEPRLIIFTGKFTLKNINGFK